MSTQEIDARFERMEHHLKLLKEDSLSLSTDIKDIKKAIVGDQYTGGVGVVHDIREMKDRINKTDDEIALLKENIAFSKNIIKIIVGVISSYVLYLLTK
jgi:hypothetical protein